MYVVCVTVWVKEANAGEFLLATLENAQSTRKEPGNLRFDILRGVDDPNRFFLYEVYRTEGDFKNHQKTEHYFTWRQTVAEWMAQPRQGIKYESVDPVDEGAWQTQQGPF